MIAMFLFSMIPILIISSGAAKAQDIDSLDQNNKDAQLSEIKITRKPQVDEVLHSVRKGRRLAKLPGGRESKQPAPELPLRKRIKRKYAGVGGRGGRYNNPLTKLLEKDPTFRKAASARVLRKHSETVGGTQNMKDNVERVRLTRGKRINYQEQRRQSIKYSRTPRDSYEETEMRESKASKIVSDENKIAKKDNPVMSVMALLD